MSAGLSWTGWGPYYGRRCPVPVDWCDRPCSCQRCRTPPARPLSAPLCAGDQPVKGKSHQFRHVYTCSLVFKGRPWSDREYRQTKMKIKEKKWTIQEIRLCKGGARVRTRWLSIPPPPLWFLLYGALCKIACIYMYRRIFQCNQNAITQLRISITV